MQKEQINKKQIMDYLIQSCAITRADKIINVGIEARAGINIDIMKSSNLSV